MTFSHLGRGANDKDEEEEEDDDEQAFKDDTIDPPVRVRMDTNNSRHVRAPTMTINPVRVERPRKVNKLFLFLDDHCDQKTLKF